MMTDGEIHNKFTELWNKKGELLVYKCFVSMYPDYALWYDQIHGSIPPGQEVEIPQSGMWDNQLGECHSAKCDSHSVSDHFQPRLEKDTCDSHSVSDNFQPRLDGDSNSSNLTSGKTEIVTSKVEEQKMCVDRSSDDSDCAMEACISLTGEVLHTGASSKDQAYSDADNKQHKYSDSDMREHVPTSTDNQEHVYCHVSSNFKKEQQTFSNQSDKEKIIHIITNKERGDNNTSNKKYGDCNKEHSNCDEQAKKSPPAVHHTETGQITLNIMNADLLTSSCSRNGLSSETVTTDCHLSVRSSNPSTGACLTLLESASRSECMMFCVTDSAACKQTMMLTGNIPQGCSDPEDTAGGQISPHEEHCYNSLQLQDHSYSGRNCYLDNGCVDETDVSDEYKHDELIATLKDTYDDLTNQVRLHVMGKFRQWLQRNPDEEFDDACLDEDLIAVTYPVLETEIMFTDYVDEQ